MSIARALAAVCQSPLYCELDWLFIDIGKQQLLRLDYTGKARAAYPISSAANGCGNRINSFQTPLGLHCIAKKIGDDCAPNEIIKNRVATHICADINGSDEDLITSRILWLQGLQAGKNMGGDIDSFRRYIYIHGSNAEAKIGTPVSRGCIRMLNADIIQLYAAVSLGCLVYIDEGCCA